MLADFPSLRQDLNASGRQSIVCQATQARESMCLASSHPHPCSPVCARRLSAVQLLGGGLAPQNVSIAAAAPGSVQGDFAAAWVAATVCEPAIITLHPGQPAAVACPRAAILPSDRLLLQAVAPAAATEAEGSSDAAAAPPALTLCELALFGLPAAPQS